MSRPFLSSSTVGLTLPILASLPLVSCAVGSPVTGAGGTRAILADEIEGHPARDVLGLVRDLRPAWLVNPNVQDPSDPWESGGPVVLVNGIPPKPLHTLQFMSLAGVEEIRFLTARDVEIRYRVRSPAGAIFIKTRSPGGSEG